MGELLASTPKLELTSGLWHDILIHVDEACSSAAHVRMPLYCRPSTSSHRPSRLPWLQVGRAACNRVLVRTRPRNVATEMRSEDLVVDGNHRAIAASRSSACRPPPLWAASRACISNLRYQALLAIAHELCLRLQLHSTICSAPPPDFPRQLHALRDI